MESVRRVGAHTLRQVNRSSILELLRTEAPLSRSELARRTGLSKPTISTIIDKLLLAGLLREVGLTSPEPAGGQGHRIKHGTISIT